ncbi:reverse transcriptase domain-containing protein [Tanacetum coccineum]
MTGATKRWVDRLSPGTIDTWDLLKKAFLERYCPPSKTAKQLEDIHNFKQEGNESLYQAWERYNDLLYKCPTHDINNHQKVNIFYKGLSTMNRQLLDLQGPIPRMTPAQALTAIQTMANHSQKWHDDTSSRNVRDSSSNNDGIVALTDKMENLGRDMKKLKESIHAIQVGFQLCEGPHLDKDCLLKEGVKQIEEAKFGDYGRSSPFNNGRFCTVPVGYKNDARPSYGEKRPSLEEILKKHQEESARRSAKMEGWTKKFQEGAEANFQSQNTSLERLEAQIKHLTDELHSRASTSGQVKVVITEEEEPSPPKKIRNIHGVSFLADPDSQDSQEEVSIEPQLPLKEPNLGIFTLPCTIGNFNFYALADLGASVSVLPRNIFEHLKLANLSNTDMIVEMADMRKLAPLGIVKKVLVKIDKFLFPNDFVILDQTPKSTVILGRPFLATIHAQISIFEKEISLGVGNERVTFNMNRRNGNFEPTKGIFMLNSVDPDNRACKKLKYDKNFLVRHYCKPIIQEYNREFKAWPSCDPLKDKCDGGHEIHGIDKLGKT